MDPPNQLYNRLHTLNGNSTRLCNNLKKCLLTNCFFHRFLKLETWFSKPRATHFKLLLDLLVFCIQHYLLVSTDFLLLNNNLIRYIYIEPEFQDTPLLSGSVGGVCALANILGQECCDLQTLALSGKHAEAQALQHRLFAPNGGVSTSNY